MSEPSRAETIEGLRARLRRAEAIATPLASVPVDTLRRAISLLEEDGRREYAKSLGRLTDGEALAEYARLDSIDMCSEEESMKHWGCTLAAEHVGPEHVACNAIAVLARWPRTPPTPETP